MVPPSPGNSARRGVTVETRPGSSAVPPAREMRTEATDRAPAAGGRPSQSGRPPWYVDVLFLSGLVLAAVVFTYFPYRFFGWARSFLVAGRSAGMVAGAVFLALVSIVSGCRWAILLVLSYLEFRRQCGWQPGPGRAAPFVSVFVPAHNESETIAPALTALLRLDYPRYEVLVVDDGSTDDTLARARRFEGRHPRCRLRVLAKPNGGKWSAHNLAFRHTRGELILCLDADSRLAPDALTRMVARIQQPGVAAVAGQVRVRNRINSVTRLQGLEYLVGNGSVRMAQGHSGTVLVVPGPIGLFRRDALAEVHRRFGQLGGDDEGAVGGPFEPDTFAEDFDLSLTILGLGGKVVYEPTAVSDTKGPDGLFDLINQRYRWCRGTIQVLRKYLRRCRRSAVNRSPRLLAWLGGTCGFDLLLQPFLFLLGVGLLTGALLKGGDPLLILTSLIPLVLLNAVAASFFVAMHRDDPKILRYCPVYDLYHTFVVSSVWVIAVLDELRGRRMRW